MVSLLCERGANVEHRAKVLCVPVNSCYNSLIQTGLTPLMEAASGGYHEVGKVLIECVSSIIRFCYRNIYYMFS